MDRRKAFIRALAEYLCGDQARKSIELQMGKPHAREWAALRSASPIQGWADVDKAEETLTRFLDTANAPRQPRRDSDVGSDALFGVSIVKVNGFRSQPRVNADEDMVRVTLDMPKHAWRELQKRLPLATLRQST